MRVGNISDQKNPFVSGFRMEPGPLARPGCQQEQQARQQKKNKARSLQGEASRLPLLLFTIHRLACARPVAENARRAQAARGPWITVQSCGPLPLGSGGLGAGRHRGAVADAWKRPLAVFHPTALQQPMAKRPRCSPAFRRVGNGAALPPQACRQQMPRRLSASKRELQGLLSTCRPARHQALPTTPPRRSPTRRRRPRARVTGALRTIVTSALHACCPWHRLPWLPNPACRNAGACRPCASRCRWPGH